MEWAAVSANVLYVVGGQIKPQGPGQKHDASLTSSSLETRSMSIYLMPSLLWGRK